MDSGTPGGSKAKFPALHGWGRSQGPSLPREKTLPGDTPPTPRTSYPSPSRDWDLGGLQTGDAVCRNLSCAGHLAHTELSSLPDSEPGLAGPLHRPDRGSEAQMHRPRPPRGWVLRRRAAAWVSLMIVHARSPCLFQRAPRPLGTVAPLKQGPHKQDLYCWSLL